MIRRPDPIKRAFAWRWLIVNGLILLPLVGCEPGGGDEGSSPRPTSTVDPGTKRQIVAVSYPLEYLTQRIAGSEMEVRCPVPAGERASQWRPQRDAILKMQHADLIVANGVGARFAKWLDTVSLPDSKICNSATRGLALADYISVDDVRLVHSHGPEGEHSHPTTVAYTWLSPLIAGKQADYIATELARVDPAKKEIFSANLQALKKDLTELAEAFKVLPQSQGDQPLVVLSANPDLKFFSQAAGWQDHHLTWFEPPTAIVAADELEKFLALNKDHQTLRQQGQTVLLSNYPFSTELLEVVRLQGVTVLVVDPMDVRPNNGDYLMVMKRNLAQFQPASEIPSDRE